MKSDKIAKYLKIVVGVALFIAGMYTTSYFWEPFIQILKGFVGPVIILLGILLAFLGVSE